MLAEVMMSLQELPKKVKDLRNTDNGVIITKEIHNEFHKIYGKKNSTKQQFLEFAEKYYNKKLTI